MHPGGASSEAEIDIAQFDGGVRHRASFIIMKTFSRRSASYGHFALRVQAAALAFTLFAAPAVARTLHVVALGDSLTAGYGLPPGQGFAEALARALKAKGWDVEVTNAGVSGETAEDGLARYNWSVPAG